MSRISFREMDAVLRWGLGSAALESEPGFVDFLTKKLNVCLYTDETPQDIAQGVRQDLMVIIYAASGKTMRLRRDDGTMKSWTIPAVDKFADQVLEVVFMHMEMHTENYQSLMLYAMNSHSLSAFKALYLRYGVYLDVRNRATVVRLIVEQFAPADYESWLSPADCPKQDA